MSALRTSRLKQYLPYLFAVGALAWIAYTRQKDLPAFRNALARLPALEFVSLSAVMLLLNCAADTFAMSTVFAWFGSRVPYRELFVVRAATYVLAVINYYVGQAAITTYLFKVRKMAFLRSSGVILFIIGVNIGTIFLLAAVGAWWGPPEVRLLRFIPVLCLLYAALITWPPRFLSSHTLLSPLFEMGVIGHLKGVLVRLPHLACLLVWHFLSLRMFHIEISVANALLYLPLYFAVSAMPINVAGIGFAQGAAIAFFSRFATGSPGERDATAFAYSIATSLTSLLLQLVLGSAFLRRATALGATTAPDVANEAAS